MEYAYFGNEHSQADIPRGPGGTLSGFSVWGGGICQNGGTTLFTVEFLERSDLILWTKDDRMHGAV